MCDGAFEYAYFTDQEVGVKDADPNYSCWALRFYGTLNFVAFTPSLDLIDPHRQQLSFPRLAADMEAVG